MRLPVIVIAATIVLTSLVSAGPAQAEEGTKKESGGQPQPGAESLPDAPVLMVVQSPPAPAATAPKISIWRQRWDYDTHHISNREVLASKSYWAFVGTDLFASSFDAEMSKHQGRCVEGGEGLSPHPTRWQLYQHNLPENAAVILVGFVATKIKMPRWLMFTGDIYPVQSHLRAGLKWYQDCW